MGSAHPRAKTRGSAQIARPPAHHHGPAVSRAASPYTRDDNDKTRRLLASRRRQFPTFPAAFHPPPPSANHHGPAVSRALRARAREMATTKRDASRRLVVVTAPAARAFLPAAHDPGPSVSRKLRGRARETTTTRRDASRRLVVVALPPPPLLPAVIHPQQTTTDPPFRAL
ncbi:hypothetical protein PLICRDRAFT_175067 [Plicaturopsis crispa FD-325 SS-3]|nr:hypothetical protein PLICRDRAFT_175067 [Plicaturopsis crispa FD-325 SS-3]